MSNLKPEESHAPQQWWQILATQSAEQPFRAYYDELPQRPDWEAADWEQELEVPGPVDFELLLRARRVEPPADRCRARPDCRRAAWGEDSRLIEDWFAEGDNQQFFTELEVEEPEPDHLDRALDWVRSLAVATKLIPA